MRSKISGKVVRGDGYGRKLGFPTMNLDTKDALPKAGVYAGSAEIENTTYRAGILVNPTGKVEAHLLGYIGDSYGKMVTLKLVKFLREYKKFENEKDLIAQIEQDLKAC
jgi:riboflavin kinase / FMN adenylyltransferase